MNKPLPRSRFGAAFADGWNRIFGRVNARSHAFDELVAAARDLRLLIVDEGPAARRRVADAVARMDAALDAVCAVREAIVAAEAGHDWRLILKKYVATVCEAEGVAFEEHCDARMSEAEVAAFRALLEEVIEEQADS